MKFYILIIASLFCSFTNVFSQELNIKHTVTKGETITKIAQQYHITANDIYQLNPSSKNGIQIKSILLIPVKNQKNKSSSSEIATNTNLIIHKVSAKETIYGLSKKYNVSVNEIYQYNPNSEGKGLKIDQEIKIPVKVDYKAEEIVLVTDKNSTAKNVEILNTKIIEEPKEDNVFIREVLPKETKYGIAKEYGISVKELENQNPEVRKSLPVGFKLNIRSSTFVAQSKVKEEIVVEQKTTSEIVLKPVQSSDIVNQLILTASENLGTRYRSGGTTKDGFDCSGLIFSTFSIYDILLPRSSFEQSHYGVVIKKEDVQKGDLIFFKTNKRKQINHVGMVVEVTNGDIKFIHSSVKGGVMISSVKEEYYAKRFTQVNRVL